MQSMYAEGVLRNARRTSFASARVLHRLSERCETQLVHDVMQGSIDGDLNVRYPRHKTASKLQRPVMNPTTTFAAAKRFADECP